MHEEFIRSGRLNPLWRRGGLDRRRDSVTWREIFGEKCLDGRVERHFVLELAKAVAFGTFELLLVRDTEFFQLFQEVF